jgi:hypothetical protein
MSKPTSQIFRLDLPLLKNRVIYKYIILFLLNASILFLSYFRMPEKNQFFLSVVFILLSFFIFLFFKNFNSQMKLFSETAFQIDKNILKLYGANSSCADLNLKDLKSIKKDRLFGYDRIILDFGENKLTYFCIEKMDLFEKELEAASGIQSSNIKRNIPIFLIKFFIIYLPSIITYYLTTFEESKINLDILYIIINLNTIFMIQHLSEDKLEGGIPSRTSRRIMIILIFFLCFQLVTVFN